MAHRVKELESLLKDQRGTIHGLQKQIAFGFFSGMSAGAVDAGFSPGDAFGTTYAWGEGAASGAFVDGGAASYMSAGERAAAAFDKKYKTLVKGSGRDSSGPSYRAELDLQQLYQQAAKGSTPYMGTQQFTDTVLVISDR